MKVFLAGINSLKNRTEKLKQIDYILESFYTIKDWEKPFIKKVKMFLLDSGAFTFMNSKSKEAIDWDKYICDYAKFILENDVKYFFELDIDNIVGLKEVERLRNKLEALTQRKCIPVWHKTRGIEYWREMTKQYSYVAIGGNAIGEISSKEYRLFKPMLEIAERNLCRVHGLGFTPTKILKQFNFWSVDSTNWLSGARFGSYYFFNGKHIISKSFKNKKGNGEKLNMHNLEEWIKFQKYADKYL